MQRQLLALALVLGASGVSAQPRSQAPFELGPPPALSEEEALEQLALVRYGRLGGDLAMDLRLLVYDGRGGRTIHRGTLWTTWRDDGAWTRLELEGEPQRRYLLRNGPEPAAWHWQGGEAAPLAPDERAGVALLDGAQVALFDLQMPYLYWPATYEEPVRVKGRPAHAYTLRSPHAGLTARIYIDARFDVLLGAEVDHPEPSGPGRSMAVISFKKFGEQWLVKALDFRVGEDRSKVRVETLRADVGAALPAELFAPSSLARPAQAILIEAQL